MSLFFWIPLKAGAQGFSMSDAVERIVAYSTRADYTTIALIATRLLLVLTLSIAAMIAFQSGYRWCTHEGNMEKVQTNKKKFANAILIITIVFFLLLMYGVFIPDLTVLQL